jgi:hypothetical protein
MLMCQRCKSNYDPAQNNQFSCNIHPESYTGETAQRWKSPGDEFGGAKIHVFYTCCGASEINSLGCSLYRHYSYNEELPTRYDTGEGQERMRKNIGNNRVVTKTKVAWGGGGGGDPEDGDLTTKKGSSNF